MITFLFFVWVFFFVTLSIKTVLRSRREKKRRQYEQELLNQQQMMLEEIALQTGMDISSVPMLANVGVEEKTKRFSIGWVVLFGILFAYLFVLAQPWIRALVILGWSDFWRMLTL
jgi:hypothetical protein